jgi:hypothetical protein
MRVNPAPIEEKKSRNVRREKRRWDDEAINSLSMGCVGCPDFDTCGGENKRQHGMSCYDDCCGSPGNCQIMCPHNSLFLPMVREINGFPLQNVEHVEPKPSLPMPVYVPVLYHRSNRPIPLDIAAAAVPFHKLYDKRDGRLRFKSPAELRQAFGISESARIILIGSGRDQPLENWWGLSGTRKSVLAGIKDLDVDMVTSPNYSLFTDVPRHDNMRNMKRIIIAWNEILAAGIPAGLHLNARAVKDYGRYLAFIEARSEVTDVAFEFRTVWPQRRSFHAWHLARIGRSVARPLTLTMVGGLPLITSLAPAFNRVTYIDSHAFMTATHRQRVVEGNDGSLDKVTAHTPLGEPIHELVGENIRIMRAYVSRLINEARARQTAAGNERTPKSLDTPVSARAAQR